ncbi:MAG: trypsin-like peptidase domain-containing protein [Planctomycetota bacterium]
MEENVNNGGNRNLITILIALIVLVVVAVIYWDRQSRRIFRQSQLGIQSELLEEWGPQTQQQINSALGATPVAFSKQISYKNIVARVVPSVVSVNVGTSFINQTVPPVQSQPVALGRGNFGPGQMRGYLFCPNCSTTMPCQRTAPGYMVNCPSCGIAMIRGGVAWGNPVPAQSQPLATQNQPADQSQEPGGFGQYVWGGRMGGWAMGLGGFLVCPSCGTQVPHQRGVPAYTVGCPNCGTQMMRQGTPGTWSAPAGTQQLAAQPKDNQFHALGRGGSGVIVNSRGYVLTNHHVVHGARNITVTLSSGQVSKKYPAELVDEAPGQDFAILKIVANGEVFTPAPIGNSSALSVGDEVLAVGSPFGLQQSVTFGIVSNTRRTLTVGNRKFTNFIQTDAPINPGSSGGPLINVNGEVVGITTAIYSPTQAFSGIGFASPIDPAKAAFPEFIDTTSNAARTLRRNIPNWARGPALKQAAQIQRGQGLYPGRQMRQMANSTSQPWLGIRVSAVDKQARRFLGLPMAYGVLVMEVYDNSPGLAAGLERGDIIIRTDNQSVKDVAMFEALLFKKRVGDKMKLTIYRDGKKMSLRVNLSAALWPKAAGAILQAQPVALPFNPENVQPPGLSGVLRGSEVGAGEIEALGMGVEQLVPELALAYGVPRGVRGLIVTESATQAAAAGLLAGDVIKAIDGRSVETIVDFIKVMNRVDLKRGITLDVYRQGQRFNLAMRS